MLENYRNKEKIFKSLYILTPMLANFVYKILKAKYKHNWWKEGIINKMDYVHIKNLPKEGSDTFLIKELDIDKLTLLITNIHWELFSINVTSKFRTYIREIRDIRNDYIAHVGSKDIADRDTERAIDTISRIIEMIGEEDKIEDFYLLINENETLHYNLKEENLTERQNSLSTTVDDAINLFLKNHIAGYALLKELAGNGDWVAKFLISGHFGIRELYETEIEAFVKIANSTTNILEANINKLDTNLKLKLADIYNFFGEEVEDPIKAIDYLLPLAELGNKDAQLMIASIFVTEAYEDVDTELEEKIRNWIFSLVHQNDSEAQHILSSMYLYGEGVERNEERAVALLKAAADQGNAGAQCSLAEAYLTTIKGIDCHKNAAMWYAKAAAQGDPLGLKRLGEFYLYGVGVEKNTLKALELLTNAAELGDHEAHIIVGNMYHNARGVSFNYQKAKDWYIKAIKIFDSYKAKECLNRLEQGLELI